ncbi:MAG: DinB family protein [Chloroflexi bacterium]|nr:DinB family protein [Chloroflexota bacterium]
MTTATPTPYAERLQRSYADLGEALALLEAEEVAQASLQSGWSPKSLVAHVAFWDDFQLRRMQAAMRGETIGTIVWPSHDNEQRAQIDSQRDWAVIIAEADLARQRLVEFAQGLSPEHLAATYPIYEDVSSLSHLLEHMVRHTQTHTAELQRYCGSMQRWQRADLRKFLAQQHINLMDSIAGMTEATILSAQVCGHWSIRDVLAHVLSWNEFAYLVLRQWPQPDKAALQAWLPAVGATGSHKFDAVNERLLAAKSDLDIIGVADWLTTYHRRTLRLFDKFSDAELASEGDYVWSETGEAARLFYEFAVHEAEHAAQIWHYRVKE